MSAGPEHPAAQAPEPPPRVELRDLCFSWGHQPVLRGLNLRVGADETVAVLGRSGSGKSTLLRLVAGLEPPQQGHVLLDGRPRSGPGWADPPHARGLGIVFQGDALWPHMSVAGNLRFTLTGLPRDAAETRIDEILLSLGIASLRDRRPQTLSGGEARRVALARALAPRPRALLLDEPLAHLDTELRDEMLALLAPLLAGPPALPTILVTHDPTVATRLAHRTLRLQDAHLTPD